MTIRYERPVSKAASWSWRLALVAFTLFFISVLAHRFGPLSTPSLLALLAASAGLALFAMLLALVGLAALWNNGARGGKAAAMAILLSIVPLLPPALAIPGYLTKPPIRDISTDLIDPPPFLIVPNADLATPSFLPTVTIADRKAQAAAYPEVSSRRYEGGLDRVLAAVRKVAKTQRIILTKESGVPEPVDEAPVTNPKPQNGEADNGDAAADNLDAIPVPVPRPDQETADMVAPMVGKDGDVILQGVYRSMIFGFRSDVIIRLREEAETTLVDMRVVSRYGVHDLGAGSATIQSMLTALDAELLGIAGE